MLSKGMSERDPSSFVTSINWPAPARQWRSGPAPALPLRQTRSGFGVRDHVSWSWRADDGDPAITPGGFSPCRSPSERSPSSKPEWPRSSGLIAFVEH